VYTAALLIGQTLGNLAAGVIADRRGHKFTLELAQWASILTFGMAWLAPNPDWYYAIFFFMGIANGISIVSGVLIVMEFSQAEHRPTYIGMGNTIVGVGSAIAPLVGGLLAALLGYNQMFLWSALLSAVALGVLSFGMREPRQHPQTDVLDEMAG
jgi:MFS family permease